ncbi:MAG TPA: arabinan endo-1,5-alpha-L-arabinosidase [Anditalea sp.]|nr:arabinan endo-1,5-alpha-L-arabinosidase [Anditalea sp.]
MKKILLLFIPFFILLFSIHAQEPVKDVPAHDPVMIKEGNKYYLFTTGRGISVWSSDDMKSWTREEQVFKEAPTWALDVAPDFKNHIWAPDIIFHEGTYYLYYSVSSFAKNTSAIGVTINKTLDSSSPDYNWQDQGIVIQSVPGRDLWNAIDPHIIKDDDGTAWMSYGSFWNGLKLVKLSDDLLSAEIGPEDWFTIARRERTFTLDDRDPGDGAVEAPFIFRKDGTYYLFVSFDLCCRGDKSTYKVVVGRSDTVQGPYLDSDGKSMFEGGGTLVVEGDKNWYGVGHNSTYTFEGKDYLIFHGYEAANEGRPKLLIREITWDENGWPTVKL